MPTLYNVSRLNLIACLIMIGVPTPVVRAQDACTALINHGIYDFGRNVNSAASSTTIRSSVCSAYNSLTQTSSGSSGGISVLDFGGASASISNQALVAIGSSLCNDSVSLANNSTASNSYSEVIDSGVLSAYNQCLLSSNSGLIVNTSYDETYNSSISIDMRFTVPGTTAKIMARGISISSLDPDPTHAATCVGPLATSLAHSPSGLPIGNSDVAMVCSRYVVADPSKAFLIAGKSVLAAPVTFTVFTDAGTVTRTLGELLAPPAQPQTSIVNSGTGSCSRTGSLQICWGVAKVTNGGNSSYRNFEIDFPEPFSSAPVVTATGTSALTYSWVMDTVNLIQKGPSFTGATGYINPVVTPVNSISEAAAFSSVPTLTYLAIGTVAAN